LPTAIACKEAIIRIFLPNRMEYFAKPKALYRNSLPLEGDSDNLHFGAGDGSEGLLLPIHNQKQTFRNPPSGGHFVGGWHEMTTSDP